MDLSLNKKFSKMTQEVEFEVENFALTYDADRHGLGLRFFVMGRTLGGFNNIVDAELTTIVGE